MSVSSEIPAARALFEAARGDAPDDPARDAIWDRVASATGAAVASTAAASQAGAAKAAASVATGAGMKFLAIGGMIGAASTALGVIIAINLSSAPAGRSAAAQPARVHSVAHGAKLADPLPRRLDPAMAIHAEDPPSSAPVTAPTEAAPATTSTDSAGDLAEEARLLTEARASLVGGDPARALSLVQATRRLGTRALEPEELGLEARALRALGRSDDAAATELLLRRRYPGHALAR